MRIAVLTSSRADYGIYLPLLKALQADAFFDLRIIAFGTHLSELHGYTLKAIEKDGFRIDHTVSHMPASDAPVDIARSMAEASVKFAEIWQKEKDSYDLVLCLGDRYEMFAAVSIAAPFGIKFAHLHGGETTLGAIDNEFRHCLTLFSQLHFVATEPYAKRVAEIKGNNENIHVVGALSLDNMGGIAMLANDEFESRFGIDIRKPSILITYHPETVAAENNKQYAKDFSAALKNFDGYQLIVTMPNADTSGLTMRQVYETFAEGRSNVKLVETFGTQGYFTCMKRAALVAGNSSSGIIEAASFGKHVIDIGDRQKGRAVSDNVIHCERDSDSITAAIREGLQRGTYNGSNIYHKGAAAEAIVSVLKQWIN